MKTFFLKSIRFYQRTAFFHQPLLKALFLSDSICRFKPSCSVYSYQAIEKYGIIRGCWLALKRIVRCHPLNKGGSDPLK